MRGRSECRSTCLSCAYSSRGASTRDRAQSRATPAIAQSAASRESNIADSRGGSASQAILSEQKSQHASRQQRNVCRRLYRRRPPSCCCPAAVLPAPRAYQKSRLRTLYARKTSVATLRMGTAELTVRAARHIARRMPEPWRRVYAATTTPA